MTLIEWRDEYRTGIQGVDYEHEELIARINTVYALVENSAERVDVVHGLDQIYGDIGAHFALEEQMMRRLNYPQYAEHRADHERLLDEIRDITEDYEKSDNLDQADFQRRLRDWFQNHFSTHDARLHRLTGTHNHDAAEQAPKRGILDFAKRKWLHRDD